MATDIRIIVPTALGSGPDVIWETNFSNDVDFECLDDQSSSYSETLQPNGWSGIKVAKGDSLGSGWKAINTGGIGNSVAMRVQYPGSTEAGGAQPTNSLTKHLTGNANTGYDELYIRYRVKLANGLKAGNGTSLDHWKWMRLWQNTNVTNVDPGKWTENREDSHYVVINWNGSLGFGPNVNVAWGLPSALSGDVARSGGSNSGPHVGGRYFVSGVAETDFDMQDGYFENVGSGGWEIDHSGGATRGELVNNTSQGWHTIEYHLKLGSTPAAKDAVFEVFFDGVDQNAVAQERETFPRLKGTVTNVTQAASNPTVTLDGPTSDVWETGDQVEFYTVPTGMTQLEGQTDTITKVSDTSFTLDTIDTSGYSPWSGSHNIRMPYDSSWSVSASNPFNAVNEGTGFNMFVLMDNMQSWNVEWGASGSFDGWIDFNDIVIATTRIGHDYNPTGDGS